jgi:hypothetical protein
MFSQTYVFKKQSSIFSSMRVNFGQGIEKLSRSGFMQIRALGSNSPMTKYTFGTPAPQIILVESARLSPPNGRQLTEDTGQAMLIGFRPFGKFSAIEFVAVIAGDGKFTAGKVFLPFIEETCFDCIIHMISILDGDLLVQRWQMLPAVYGGYFDATALSLRTQRWASVGAWSLQSTECPG